MTKPHINVLIATPGHSMVADYVKSLIDTLALCSSRGISVAYLSQYSSLVANAREITLSGSWNNAIEESRPLSGEVTYDKIFWIDSDISWTPEDFLKLYESDLDVVSGVYVLSSGTIAAYTSPNAHMSVEDLKDKTEPFEIIGCGFGFLAVKSGIFEKIKRPWFSSVTIKLGEGDSAIDFPVSGEDISWCIKTTDLGYKINLDPTVLLTHHKTMPLSLKGQL